MRRAYRLLCLYSLSRTTLSSHTTLLSNPRSLIPLQFPSNRLIQSLSNYSTLPSFEAFSQGDERQTGLDCLNAAEQIVKGLEPENLEKALNLGIRALNIFRKSDGGWSFQVARSLVLLGQVSFKLKKHSESLDSLNASIEILNSLETGDTSNSEIGLLAIEANNQIAKIKSSLGKKWDALLNLKRVLEIKLRIFGPNHKDMRTAYEVLADAYVVALEYKDALPLYLKLLEINKLEFGANSVEVANIRINLGVVYTALGEDTQAREQTAIAKSIVDGLGPATSTEAEIDIANLLIMTDQLEEATDYLRKAILKVDKESELKACMLVGMAKILCQKQQFSDAKRCIEISLEILEKKESASLDSILGIYADICLLYLDMDEYEIPLSLSKRALSIIREREDTHHLEGSIAAHLGWLLIITNRVDQAVPYLELAIERLELRLSKRNIGLGLPYKNLGRAYLETDRPEMAVWYLNLSKEIIVENFGPYHEYSIDVYQYLANAYGTMGSYKLAMEFQELVVEGWKRHGADAIDNLREACRLREQLKKKSEGHRAAVFPANSLPAMLLPKK